MEVKIIVLNEIRQIEKDKFTCSFSYAESSQKKEE
jgi:hypothetical protein